MAPDDPLRYRAAIAALHREMDRLEVTEQAETIVRQHHQQLLERQLVEALRDLDAAVDRLRRLRSSDDLSQILTAEQEACAVERHTVALRQFAEREQHLAQQAQTTCASACARILRRIDELRQAIRWG